MILSNDAILALARKCAIQRQCNRHAMLRAPFHSQAFRYFGQWLARRNAINAMILARCNPGRRVFAARLAQLISRAPRIKFWSQS